LSVSTPIQLAAAELLRRGAPFVPQVQTRVRNNYRRCTLELATSVL
jgi:hypothetical protein